MGIEEQISGYGLSDNVLSKLHKFAEILGEWNAKMNLVSKNSFSELWSRHILDSLQLIDYLPEGFGRLVDIGSGAGFPAIVLAIAEEQKNPAASITMVESITKKTTYLNDVVKRLNLQNSKVINSRVENTKFEKVDVVTARAVAALDVLLSYQQKIGNGRTVGVYLKGKSYTQELEIAQKNWDFKCEVLPNKYNDEGVILKISELRRKK